MVVITGFKHNSKNTVGNLSLTRSLMVDADNVSTVVGDDLRYAEKLTWFIVELNTKRLLTSRCNKTALNYSVKNCNVDITARNYTYNLLTLTGSLLNITAAKGAAPAPSATIFCFSIRVRIAVEISSSDTVTTSSTYC